MKLPRSISRLFLPIFLVALLLLSACAVDLVPTVTRPEESTSATEPDAETETNEEIIITMAPTDETTPQTTVAPTTAPEVTSETQDIPDSVEPTAPPEGQRMMAPAIRLKDQNGVEHTLEDYRGKVIFLNCWATWCGPCQIEMPDIQAAYEKYGENKNEVVILGVASPRSEHNTFTHEGTVEEVTAYLTEHEYTYPSLMDETGNSFNDFGIYSIPMTYMIDREGYIYGLMRGMVTAEQIEMMIEQTLKDS